MRMTVFPFLVGSGRSGTTLLQLMLEQHPDLATVHESHFIAPMARRSRRYRRGAGFDTPLFVEDLYHDSNFRRLGLTRSELHSMLDKRNPADFADAVRIVFEMLADKRGKTRYADKTPGYVGHIDRLARVFPEAKFVHIIRDGRDVALAFVDTSWGPPDIATAALHWRANVSRGRNAGRRLGESRYMEVRYEDLLETTEDVLQRVCDFLDLDVREEMLMYHLRSERFLESTPDPTVHANLLLPPTKGLRDWRNEMSERDVATFEALAGGLLSSLGYDRHEDSPSIGARARALRVLVRWNAMRLRALAKRIAQTLY